MPVPVAQYRRFALSVPTNRRIAIFRLQSRVAMHLKDDMQAAAGLFDRSLLCEAATRFRVHIR